MLRMFLRPLPLFPPFPTSGLSHTSPTTSVPRSNSPSNSPHFIPTLPIQFQTTIPPPPPFPSKPESNLPLHPASSPPTPSATLIQILSPQARDSVHRQPRSAFCAPFHTSPKRESSRDSMITRMPSLDPVRLLQTYWTLRLPVCSTSNIGNPGNNRKGTECTTTLCCMRLA